VVRAYHVFCRYDGPSGAGPWILWQQPHPLSFAEMAYRAEPSAATLARYNQTVHDTADFMADFVLQQQSPPAVAGGCYSLGAPMFTAEIESFEGRPAAQAKDGTFELVYQLRSVALAIGNVCLNGIMAVTVRLTRISDSETQSLINIR
jgi:hypothetical protein